MGTVQVHPPCLERDEARPLYPAVLFSLRIPRARIHSPDRHGGAGETRTQLGSLTYLELELVAGGSVLGSITRFAPGR